KSPGPEARPLVRTTARRPAKSPARPRTERSRLAQSPPEARSTARADQPPPGVVAARAATASQGAPPPRRRVRRRRTTAAGNPQRRMAENGIALAKGEKACGNPHPASYPQQYQKPARERAMI